MLRNFSPRLYIVVVTVLTLVLLIGSTILQQLVFKADQEQATLSLSPTSFRTSEGGHIEIDIQSGSGDTVFATGLQVDLRYGATSLEFIEAVPVTGWSTLSLRTAVGEIQWLAAPTQSENAIAELNGSSVLGRLRFRALVAGVTTVDFNQAGTILAAVDPVGGNFVYNAATSVQNTAGTIASANELGLEFPETSVETLTAPETTTEPLFGSQRIVSTYAVPGSRDALIFINFAYPGRAQVEFGVTAQFGNRVESLAENTHHVIQLSNLAAATQYYYRVIGNQTGEQSRVVGTTRSLTLPSVSGTGVVSAEKSEVIVFPNKTAREATLYIFPRDQEGATIGTSTVSLPELKNIQAGQPKKQVDYLQFELTSLAENREVVTIRPIAEGGTTLDSASLIVDPNYVAGVQNRSVKELVLDWNQKTVSVAFGSVVALFLLGLLFVHLARRR